MIKYTVGPSSRTFTGQMELANVDRRLRPSMTVGAGYGNSSIGFTIDNRCCTLSLAEARKLITFLLRYDTKP